MAFPTSTCTIFIALFFLVLLYPYLPALQKALKPRTESVCANESLESIRAKVGLHNTFEFRLLAAASQQYSWMEMSQVGIWRWDVDGLVHCTSWCGVRSLEVWGVRFPVQCWPTGDGLRLYSTSPDTSESNWRFVRATYVSVLSRCHSHPVRLPVL